MQIAIINRYRLVRPDGKLVGGTFNHDTGRYGSTISASMAITFNSEAEAVELRYAYPDCQITLMPTAPAFA